MDFVGQNGNGLKTDKNGNRTEIKRERNGITHPVVRTVNGNFFLCLPYMMVKENWLFTRLNPSASYIEERHTVDLDSAYKNDCIRHA